MNGDKVRPSEDALRAELAMSAPLTGAAVALTFSTRTVGELDLAESVSVLTAKVAAVQGGDLREAEAILTAQALALNAIFTEMAVYAGLNMKHSLDVVERCMRLALKAQGQCRVTLETLAAIKNPPAAVFARQANIAHGPQQVNNEASARAATTTRECLQSATRAKRTIGASGWPPAGHRNGGRARRKRCSNGDRGSTRLARRTADGKSRSARNADKGGEWRKLREMVKTLNQAMRQHRQAPSICLVHHYGLWLLSPPRGVLSSSPSLFFFSPLRPILASACLCNS